MYLLITFLIRYTESENPSGIRKQEQKNTKEPTFWIEFLYTLRKFLIKGVLVSRL